jgi:hypothetical protein
MSLVLGWSKNKVVPKLLEQAEHILQAVDKR